MNLKTFILGLVLASSAIAASVTLTMDAADGVAGSPAINGLVVTKGGITFTFSNPSNTLNYNTPNGGIETFTQDPTIEGFNSPFGVTFSVPVYTVRFGFTVSAHVPVAQMATVSLFNNSAVPFATFPLASSLVDTFAEGQFVYNGSQGPVTSILVTPTPSAGNFVALAFDNLSVDTSSSAAVPAASPLTLSLMALCLAAFGALALRKQFA